MLPKLITKLLLGTSLFTSVSLLPHAWAKAASLSEIPLSAVTIEYEQSPISTSPLTLGFQVSVAQLPELDPNLRLTSFTAALARSNGEIFGSNARTWIGLPAPGWEVTGIGFPEPGGYRFDALSPENGILLGNTLSGFIARSSAISIRDTTLQVTSISSTAVPEPSKLLGILAVGAFLGTSVVLKHKRKQQELAKHNLTV